MDWFYGYVTAWQHTALVAAAKPQWEVDHTLSVLSIIVSIIVAIVTGFLARATHLSTERATQSAIKAEEFNRTHVIGARRM